jgi:hypothetical protein
MNVELEKLVQIVLKYTHTYTSAYLQKIMKCLNTGQQSPPVYFGEHESAASKI